MSYQCILNHYTHYDTHMGLLYVCSSIVGMIFMMLIYSLIKCRHAKGKQAAHFHVKLRHEILWTTLPFIILVALAVPAVLQLTQCDG